MGLVLMTWTYKIHPRELIHPFSHVMTQGRGAIYESGGGPSSDIESDALILHFQPSERSINVYKPPVL
jgi:hypothetical protein